MNTCKSINASNLESVHVLDLTGDLDVVMGVGSLPGGDGLAAHIGHGLLAHVEPDELVALGHLLRDLCKAGLGGLAHPEDGEAGDPPPVRELVRGPAGVTPLDIAVTQLDNHRE